MVANISTGNDVYGALAYNQQKVDKGAGAVLATHIIREPTAGRCSVAGLRGDAAHERSGGRVERQ